MNFEQFIFNLEKKTIRGKRMAIRECWQDLLGIWTSRRLRSTLDGAIHR